MPVGRPTTFDPEIGRKILAHVSKGIPLKTASQSLGVPVNKVHRWLKCGERQEFRYQGQREFRNGYMKAVAEGRFALENAVLTAAAHEPKLALEILSRRWPDEWGTEKGELRKLRRESEEMRRQLAEIKAMLDGSGSESNGDEG